MKKILSLIAASAMILAMVGCEITIEPKDFEAQTKEISPVVANRNSDTAYEISNAEVVSGGDCLEVVYTSSKITFKTKKEGSATVTFWSAKSAKIAENIRLSIGSSGSISTSFTPLSRYTYNTTTGTLGAGINLDSWWKDDPKTINPAADNAYYYNNLADGSYMLVNGNILYLMEHDSSSSTAATIVYKWVRGVASSSEANKLTVSWDTYGRVWAGLNTKEMIAYEESNTNNGISQPTLNNADYFFTSGKIYDGNNSNPSYEFIKINNDDFVTANKDDSAIGEWPDADAMFVWPKTWSVKDY